MSKVAKRERIETETSEPLLDGGYQTRCYEQFAWQCLGCGLVWPRKSHAANCESRDHAVSFEDGPYGVTHVENGRLMGNPHWFTRRALRRDKPTEAAAPKRAAYDADDRAFDAWTEHVAALRVPKQRSVPAWKAQGILPAGPPPRRITDRQADNAIERQMSAEPAWEEWDAWADRMLP